MLLPALKYVLNESKILFILNVELRAVSQIQIHDILGKL